MHFVLLSAESGAWIQAWKDKLQYLHVPKITAASNQQGFVCCWGHLGYLVVQFHQGKARGKKWTGHICFFFQLSSSTHGSGETPVWCLAGFQKAPNEKINRNAISRCFTVGDQPCLLSMEAKGRAVDRVTLYEHTHISYPLIFYSWEQIKAAQQIQTDGNLIFNGKKETRRVEKVDKIWEAEKYFMCPLRAVFMLY